MTLARFFMLAAFAALQVSSASAKEGDKSAAATTAQQSAAAAESKPKTKSKAKTKSDSNSDSKAKDSPDKKWGKDIANFDKADAATPPPASPVLFVGSSSMRLWKTLAQDFPTLPVLNRGFGGSQLSDVNHFLDKVVLRYKPKTIVFYCGGNDLSAKKTPARVLADWQSFATRVREALPAVRILYVAIRPSLKRATLRPIEDETNAMIRADVEKRENMLFVDTTAALCDSSGKARADLLADDNLHLNAAGYAVWTQQLTPLLKD